LIHFTLTPRLPELTELAEKTEALLVRRMIADIA